MYTLLWYQSRSFFCSQEGLLLWGKKCIQRRGSEISNDCSTSFQRRNLVAVLLFFSLLLGERQRERDRGYCDFFPVKAFFASFRKTYCSFFKKKENMRKTAICSVWKRWKNGDIKTETRIFSFSLGQRCLSRGCREEITPEERSTSTIEPST